MSEGCTVSNGKNTVKTRGSCCRRTKLRQRMSLRETERAYFSVSDFGASAGVSFFAASTGVSILLDGVSTPGNFGI